MHVPRHWHALAVVVPVVAVASACGGGSHSAAHTDVASKTPEAILRSVRRAVHAAKSVHVAGGSPAQSLDLRLVAGGGAVGDVTQGGDKLQLVRIGPTAYVKGDAATIKSLAGAKAAQKLGGRWLKLPIADPAYKSIKMLTAMSDLVGSAVSPNGSTLTKLPRRTIRGVPVIGLEDQGRGVLYIAATGQPYPVEIDGAPGQHDKVVFSDWNTPVTLQAPANAIGIKQLTKKR
jgi:hypothetical protein